MRPRRYGLKSMIVVVIITVLVSAAFPIYRHTLRRSKEGMLKNNLFTLRTVIKEYANDKKKSPQSLYDLVSEGYLRQVPVDPMTGTADTWKIIMEDAMNTVDRTEPGIFGVQSGSDKISLEGTPYSEW